MHITRILAVGLLLLAGLIPHSARAETHHTCAGFIDSLPATISTQGVWCLRHDLSTAITSGAAITIATNNVTIDCNDFKIGGLAAGDDSAAWGIHALARQNATVRHCNIRGFFVGIFLENNSGAGHLVEDNRLDLNLYYGIYVQGDNNRVRRNAVYDTGGGGGPISYGIYANADIMDNTVAGVIAAGTNTNPRGIVAYGTGTEVRGNQVRGLVVFGSGAARGISILADGVTVAGNRIAGTPSTAGYGIYGNGSSNTLCTGNIIAKYETSIANCQDAGGNASN